MKREPRVGPWVVKVATVATVATVLPAALHWWIFVLTLAPLALLALLAQALVLLQMRTQWGVCFKSA
jgi:hypothetical protein